MQMKNNSFRNYMHIMPYKFLNNKKKKKLDKKKTWLNALSCNTSPKKNSFNKFVFTIS